MTEKQKTINRKAKKRFQGTLGQAVIRADQYNLLMLTLYATINQLDEIKNYLENDWTETGLKQLEKTASAIHGIYDFIYTGFNELDREEIDAIKTSLDDSYEELLKEGGMSGKES